MSSELLAALRKWGHDSSAEKAGHRKPPLLPLLNTMGEAPRKIIFDTTVYVDILQERFGASITEKLGPSHIHHCTVTASELSYLAGRLRPSHPGTRVVVNKIQEALDHRESERNLAPDAQVWLQAGAISGIFDRTFSRGGTDKIAVLNDALIFLTALKHGCTVLTRNIRDFDLLQQIIPEGRVLFYERTA